MSTKKEEVKPDDDKINLQEKKKKNQTCSSKTNFMQLNKFSLDINKASLLNTWIKC